MPLASQDAKPWGIAVKQGEPAFADFISKSIIDWDKTGFILSLETKYGIKHAAFAVQMHDKYK
jgi:polar amino acid transport system substrate-binding protein